MTAIVSISEDQSILGAPWRRSRRSQVGDHRPRDATRHNQVGGKSRSRAGDHRRRATSHQRRLNGARHPRRGHAQTAPGTRESRSLSRWSLSWCCSCSRWPLSWCCSCSVWWGCWMHRRPHLTTLCLPKQLRRPLPPPRRHAQQPRGLDRPRRSGWLRRRTGRRRLPARLEPQPRRRCAERRLTRTATTSAGVASSSPVPRPISACTLTASPTSITGLGTWWSATTRCTACPVVARAPAPTTAASGVPSTAENRPGVSPSLVLREGGQLLTTRSVAWCSASVSSAPDRSGLLRFGCLVDPVRSRRNASDRLDDQADDQASHIVRRAEPVEHRVRSDTRLFPAT
jgi:hypothetical protein